MAEPQELSKASATGCVYVALVVLMTPVALVLFAFDQPVLAVALLVGLAVGYLVMVRRK